MAKTIYAGEKENSQISEREVRYLQYFSVNSFPHKQKMTCLQAIMLEKRPREQIFVTKRERMNKFSPILNLTENSS